MEREPTDALTLEERRVGGREGNGEKKREGKRGREEEREAGEGKGEGSGGERKPITTSGVTLIMSQYSMQYNNIISTKLYVIFLNR